MKDVRMKLNFFWDEIIVHFYFYYQPSLLLR